MQDLEGLVPHLLLTISLDIVTQEINIGRKSLNRILQIVFVIHLLLGVSQVRNQSLEAGMALKILLVDHFLDVEVEELCLLVWTKSKHFHDLFNNLFEAFEIPVLIDYGMYHSCQEYSLRFLR